MDTSPEYIKMCEKAKEIQKDWKISAWDYAYFPKGWYRSELLNEKRLRSVDKEMRVYVLSGYETDGGYYGPCAEDMDGRFDLLEKDYKGMIWLPRQDQLQEIAQDAFYYEPGPDAKFPDRESMIEEFYHFNLEIKHSALSPNGEIPSEWGWEIRWLMFTMNYKFNKIWNSEDWVKA